MAKFEVDGPLKVPVHEGANGRIVGPDEGDEFFKEHRRLKGRRGCYVFGIRGGRGVTPVYVGKATKTFGQECFTYHKLGKCNKALVECLKGTLVLYFLVAPNGKGRPPTNQIADLESFLIEVSVAKNPGLLNVKGTKRADWSISGVIRAGRGKPPKAARSLKSALGL